MSNSNYGPENPHPLSRIKTELVWEGKYDEYGRKREVSLPTFPLVMQKIETIDEPRDRSKAQGSLFDETTAHRDDFRNRLIWGDNKLAASALLNEFRGQVKLVYIDPPFDVGADFSAKVLLGESGEASKAPSILEDVAYKDTWGRHRDSYLQMLYDRLALIKELLADDGSVFVHLDWHVAHSVKVVLDEVFGSGGKSGDQPLPGFRNEIIWCYSGGGLPSAEFPRKHDTILWYTKGSRWTFNTQYREYSEGTKQRGRTAVKGEHAQLREEGTPINDWWPDVKKITSPTDPEKLYYDTQKSEDLLERVIRVASNEGDLVADLFVGSGTTAATAEKLGRRWIACDLGRYAIHTARKRLIGVQRELNADGKPYRSFDLYNLGRYERQWWQQDRLLGANEEHRTTVLKFFRAQVLSVSPSPLLHATKAGSYVHVDDIDSILTYEELAEVARSAQQAGGKGVICLAWEFQMDLKTRAQALEAELGIDIRLTYIPREIMEPNRDVVQFFDAAALDAEALVEKAGGCKKVDVKLTRFIPSLTEVPEKELKALQERAVRSPFDFIDFWAVDFEHREDKPFEHHWQDYRTRKDRSLLTQSNCGWEYDSPGKKLICLKVIDVFGIDTTKVIEVNV